MVHIEVFYDLLMEEVSLFVLLGLISVREVEDIELYPNNMYGQNTEDQNVNECVVPFCSLLFLGVPNDFFSTSKVM